MSDLAALREVIALSQTTDATLRRLIALAREGGATWTEIGALYGVSKQAAQQRFGR